MTGGVRFKMGIMKKLTIVLVLAFFVSLFVPFLVPTFAADPTTYRVG